MDLVRTIQAYCTSKNYEFNYGNKSYANLTDSILDTSKVFLFLFPIRRTSSIANSMIRDTTYKGSFIIGKLSNYDQHYFSERQQPEADSKFTKHIEPLIVTELGEFAKYINCTADLDLKSLSSVEVSDQFDMNVDGLLVDFEIKS